MATTASTETIINANDIDDSPKKELKKSTVIIAFICVPLLYVHFIWALTHFLIHSYETLGSTACSGFGFYLLLFVIVNFGIAYKLVLKSFFFVPLIKALTPGVKLFRKIPYGTLIFQIVILIAILAFIVVDAGKDRWRLMPLSGLVIYLFIGFILSPFKSKIPWNLVLSGLIAQFVLGLITIRWEVGRNIFSCVGDKVDTFLHYAVKASAFVYGENLVNEQAVFAFNALAAIYLMSFSINILYYYGITQSIILNLGMFLKWILGTPMIESVNSAANIFLGMSESPFLLKPYLDHLTDSEIHSIMTSGLASVSGTVLAAYISFGANPAHLVTSCVMSAPAALCYSKLMYPETEEVIVKKQKIKEIQLKFESVMDAAIKGASEASAIVIGIISNLIAFIATVHFINGVLGWMGALVGFVDKDKIWSLELILGKVFIPLTYTMGVEWEDCEKVAQLIGIKTFVNEFVAFEQMSKMTDLKPKSKIIATYSICGFANPGSVGILLSTLGTYMPNKKDSLSRLIFRAFVAGCIACFMTACIAGLLTP